MSQQKDPNILKTALAFAVSRHRDACAKLSGLMVKLEEKRPIVGNVRETVERARREVEHYRQAELVSLDDYRMAKARLSDAERTAQNLHDELAPLQEEFQEYLKMKQFLVEEIGQLETIIANYSAEIVPFPAKVPSCS
jgi:chromosome segregation ATPase